MKLHSPSSIVRFLPAFLLGSSLLCLFAPSAFAQTEASETAGSESAEAAAAQLAAAAADADKGAVADLPAARWAQEDEKHEWEVDPDNGRQFRIDEIPRYEGGYKWMDEEKTRVRMPGGVSFEVLEYDEEKFRVKVWRPEWPKAAAARRNREALKEERIAAQRETAEYYKIEQYKTVDRLKLEEFGKGLPRAGQWRNGFDLADMNGDGHLDIVHGPARKSSPVPNIFLHDGAGNWERWNARFPSNPYDYGDAAVGDWNGDGHNDLALGIHLRGMIALVSDGKGGFENWTEGIALEMPGAGGDASTFSSRSIVAVDWDKDGDDDILALGEGPKGLRTTGTTGRQDLINTARSLLLYDNQGDGTWAPRTFLDEDNPLDAHFGDDFDFGDFNGDGETDIVIASRRRNAQNILALSTSDGTLVNGSIDKIRPDATVFASTVADFDGDGRDDVALAYISNEVAVPRTVVDLYYARDEMQWERRPLEVIDGRIGVFVLQTGDLNGDGRLDLGAMTGDGRILIFLGGDHGTWQRETMAELPEPAKGCQGYELIFEDLDGDSVPEILAGFAGESTGVPAFPALHNPGCHRGGSLRVWKVTVDG